MKMNERHKKILQLLNNQGRISVTTLSQQTGVSEVTIRNDLTLLEKHNYLKRVHGSAVTLESDDVNDRLLFNFPLKHRLAQYAANLIQSGDTVFIEGGSTNALLARELITRADITIITVSVYIASILKNAACEVILLGGILQKKSESVVGPLVKTCINQIHFNKSFVGIDGFDDQCGFTGRDMMRADVINEVLKKCTDTTIITESSKFGQINLYSLIPASAIKTLVTDDKLSAHHETLLSEQGITVLKVPTLQPLSHST